MAIQAHTVNILGFLNDPFEFEGDYGEPANAIRRDVWDLTVSREALFRYYNEEQAILELHRREIFDVTDPTRLLLDIGVAEDREHGPTLGEVITDEQLEALAAHAAELKDPLLTSKHLSAIRTFRDTFSNVRPFRFFHDAPYGVINGGIEITLLRESMSTGGPFDLPILGSTAPLSTEGMDSLSKDLLTALFTPENLERLHTEKMAERLRQGLEDYPLEKLHDRLGPSATKEHLATLHSSAGQLFITWAFRAHQLHLIKQHDGLLEQVNMVKRLFADTLADPEVRAEISAQRLRNAGNTVLFTQECDQQHRERLVEAGYFPVDDQPTGQGAIVFLHSDFWTYHQPIRLADYNPETEGGRVSALIATHRATGKPFLLVSGHGDSNDYKDAIRMVSAVKAEYERLHSDYPALELIIGIDANTKGASESQAFLDHLERIGLKGTDVGGPTVVKRRMLTTQHHKAGKPALDDMEDYLITLADRDLVDVTIGFQREHPGTDVMLPNLDNLSDHYPVGARITIQG